MFEDVSEIILKVTRDCNLRCAYCYVKDKDRYRGERMSLETFQSLIRQIVVDKNKNRRTYKESQLSIIFHGGEPLLLGVQLLQSFIEYARQFFPEVTFSLQTNGTLLDREWLSFIKDNTISLGVSIDGLSAEDNFLRTGGRDILLDKLQLLKEAGVAAGFLMVATSKNYKKLYAQAYDLQERYACRNVKINFVEQTTIPEKSPLEVSGNDLFKYIYQPFLQDVRLGGVIPESNTLEYIRAFLSNEIYHTLCGKTPCVDHCNNSFCAGGNHLAEVDPEGHVVFCGRWSDADECNTIGDFLQPDDPWGLVSFKKVLDVHLLKLPILKKNGCADCPAHIFCNSGCLAFAIDKQGTMVTEKRLFCALYKRIYSELLRYRYDYYVQGARALGYRVRVLPEGYALNIPPPSFAGAPKKLSDGVSWIDIEKEAYIFIPKSNVSREAQII